MPKMFSEDEKAVVCSWCQKILKGTPRPDGSNVSHTICQECFDKYYPEDEDEE